MIEQLKKYCDPTRGHEITRIPWTANIYGEDVTFATDGSLVVIVPGKISGCLLFNDEIGPESMAYFGRKEYDNKISTEEIKDFAGKPLWPIDRAGCQRCKGSKVITCPECSGSGVTECLSCDSAIDCDCGDGKVGCPSCAKSGVPVNAVWLGGALVNAVYVARILEIFTGPTVFFLLPDPYGPIFLSDGTNRAGIMPRRADEYDANLPRLRLEPVNQEEES